MRNRLAIGIFGLAAVLCTTGSSTITTWQCGHAWTFSIAQHTCSKTQELPGTMDISWTGSVCKVEGYCLKDNLSWVAASYESSTTNPLNDLTKLKNCDGTLVRGDC